MQADSYFAIGSSHLVCQDYTYAQCFPPYILLSDGCSSSKDTDIGSRLLVRNFACYLDENKFSEPDNYAKTREEISPYLLRALNQATAMGLEPEALDATILWSYLQGEMFRIGVWGDGAYAARRKDGSFIITTIEFTSNAPYYSSYLMDAGRNKVYWAYPDNVVIKRFWDSRFKVWVEDRYDLKAEEPFVTASLPVSEYNLIMLFSDGVESFYAKGSDLGRGKLFPVESVVEEIMNLKGEPYGQFIARRAMRCLKSFADQKISHYDDFSVAALYVNF